MTRNWLPKACRLYWVTAMTLACYSLAAIAMRFSHLPDLVFLAYDADIGQRGLTRIRERIEIVAALASLSAALVGGVLFIGCFKCNQEPPQELIHGLAVSTALFIVTLVFLLPVAVR